MDVHTLRRLVRQGEGQHLEFKRKASHPDKIARELVAFANSGGGTLLIGVDDDGGIFGSKHPEEDAYAIREFVRKNCHPHFPMRITRIGITSRRVVLALEVQPGKRPPHSLKTQNGRARRQVFVRIDDMSIQASKELVSVMRHQARAQSVNITFGDEEKRLLEVLDDAPPMFLEAIQEKMGLNRERTADLLVLMARAGLVAITPSQKGDLFALAPQAFSD